MDIDDAITKYTLFMEVVENEGTSNAAKFSEIFLREYAFLIISIIVNVMFVLSDTSLPCERRFRIQN